MNVMFTLGSQASVAVAVPNTGAFGQKAGSTKGGQVRMGGLMSTTEMVRLQVIVLPQSSVAVHVRVTLKVPGQLPGVVTVVKVTTTLASQASVAVAVPNEATAGQLMGEVTDGQVMTGGVTSRTETVRLQVDVLPQSSVAVHVRVML